MMVNEPYPGVLPACVLPLMHERMHTFTTTLVLSIVALEVFFSKALHVCVTLRTGLMRGDKKQKFVRIDTQKQRKRPSRFS